MSEYTPDLTYHFYSTHTSQEVLDNPSWADDVDPRKVDFSERHSFAQNEIQFDEFGRPINPWVTADELAELGENRGDLGNWGVNHAADPVVIAESTAKQSILLIKRNDDGAWAFPGGMVDPGELASVTAKRELKEEAGIDLTEVEATTIYTGYAKDRRNTKHAWIETAAALMVVDFKPQPKADGQEVSDARWFNLESLEQLLAETDGLYANHAEILQVAISHLFNHKMRRAQELFGQGKFEQSRNLYKSAQSLAPDDFEATRALRGEAACLDKGGSSEVSFDLAQKVYNKYSELLHTATTEEAEFAARRERAESATFAGKIALREAIDGEINHFPSKVHYQIEALSYLNKAYEELKLVEARSGQIDQYTINLMARLSIANSLFGDKKEASRQALQALKIGFMSESPQLATAAEISPSYRGLAKLRAVIRGAGSVIVNQAVKANYKLGLKISKNKYLI